MLTGVKAHFRVSKADALIVDWRLVHIDKFWCSEHAAAEAGFQAAREYIDGELVENEAAAGVRADAIQYKQKRQIVRPIARTIWRLAGRS